jgi:hypothetical protein
VIDYCDLDLSRKPRPSEGCVSLISLACGVDVCFFFSVCIIVPCSVLLRFLADLKRILPPPLPFCCLFFEQYILVDGRVRDLYRFGGGGE